MTPHALAPLVIGTLVRRCGNWVTLKLFYLLAAVFIFIIPFTISPMALYVVQILIGFSLGIIFSLLLGMSIESVPADMRATSMGAYQALYARGIFGGPADEGFFKDWLGLRAEFYFAAVLGLAAVILAQLICEEPMRKNRRSITRHDFIFVYAFKKEEILFG